jgi:choline dehydrogenase-like flavoprotein
MNDYDVRRFQRAIEILARVFFEAGARRVFPSAHGFDVLDGPADLDRLRRARLRAGDLEVTAYHPLGTARMGIDPATSVVGPDHQAHDVRGLYIVDGSAVPSALGVNPQVTIMAMATRAAEILDRRLSDAERGEARRTVADARAAGWA